MQLWMMICRTVCIACVVFLCVISVSEADDERQLNVQRIRNRRNADSVPSIYQQIAQLSGGSVFHTDKNNVSNVAGIIKNSAHPYVLLSSFSLSSTDSPYRVIHIDNTISHVKINIMETSKTYQPIIAVSSPHGSPVLLYTNYLGNGALEIIFTASDFGSWLLHKQDSYSWDVSVYGETTVDFSNTFFSTQGTPGLTLQLEGKPIVGENTPVIIHVSGANKIASVDGVIFLSTNGTELSRFPLLPQGHTGDTFKTQTMIPNDAFRVAIEGKDKIGNIFLRSDKTVTKGSALQLKIQKIQGDLQVNGHMYVYITATNQGSNFDQVTIAISDDKGLVVPPTDKLVYLWPGVSVTVYFEIYGGTVAGVSSNVMIKASANGADSDDFQYVMRTFTVHSAIK